jgi:hypothetical protein
MPLRMILRFAANTAAELLAAFTANGEMGYRTDSVEGFVGRVGGADKRFLMEGDVVATLPASEIQTGVVQIATTAEFVAGTNDDGAGNPLTIKPSDLRTELDTKVEIGGDLTGTADAPIVQSSTQDSGLLLKNVAGSQQGRIKPTGAAEVSVRTAADDNYAALKTGATTINGDLLVTGNVTFQPGATTLVETTDMVIKDNRVTLNAGETGNGVSLGTAGIDVKRGTEQDASLVFDESDDTWKSGIGATLFALARIYSSVLGAAATSHVVTHNLKTKNVIVSVYDGDEKVYCNEMTSTVDTVTLVFSLPVTGYRVVITG